MEEPALYSPKKYEVTVLKCLFNGFSMLCVIGMIVLFASINSKDSTGVYVGSAILVLWLLVAIVAICNIEKSNQYCKKEYISSIKRLIDIDYVMALRNAGFSVPREYLDHPLIQEIRRIVNEGGEPGKLYDQFYDYMKNGNSVYLSCVQNEKKQPCEPANTPFSAETHKSMPLPAKETVKTEEISTVGKATQIQEDLLKESPYCFNKKLSKPTIMVETAALCSFIDYLKTRSDEYDPIDVDAYVKAFQLSETDRSAFEARLCDYIDMCLSKRVLSYSVDFFRTLYGQHEELKLYSFRHYLFAYAVFVSRPFSAGNVDLVDANIDALLKISKNELVSITYTSAFKNALFVAYENLH
jgi:hypothetical protein